MCSMQVLRNTLNCTLPVEVVYNGAEEMGPDLVHKFEVGALSRPSREASGSRVLWRGRSGADERGGDGKELTPRGLQAGRPPMPA